MTERKESSVAVFLKTTALVLAYLMIISLGIVLVKKAGIGWIFLVLMGIGFVHWLVRGDKEGKA